MFADLAGAEVSVTTTEAMDDIRWSVRELAVYRDVLGLGNAAASNW